MNYLTQKELKEMMILSWKRVEKEKEEINKINVFPVPDQDTGNNLAKTLTGIKDAISEKNFKNLKDLCDSILDGALTFAQGNAGVIYTGFLAGFLSQIDENPSDVKKLALAFEKGAKRARSSIQQPKEGTILDVIDAAAKVFRENEDEKNIIDVLKKAEKEASKALLETREKMEIFKKANVVDAGGLGFLIILESYLDALEDKKKEIEEKEKAEKTSKKIKRFIQVISNRYEVVSLIEDLKFGEKEIREKLAKLGDYLDIVQIKNRMKIHIHTDYPDEVKETMRDFGKIINLKTEDMANQIIGQESSRTVSIGIVTDSASMLLAKIKERYKIEEIAVNHSKETQKSEQKDYFAAFKKHLESFDKILCITSSSKMYDSYSTARKAKEMLQEPKRVFVLDSQNAAAGQSLLVLRAIELIQEQREFEQVIEKLKEEIPKIHLYIAIENPKLINQKLVKFHPNWMKKVKNVRVHPILEIKKGQIVKGGFVFGKNKKQALLRKLIKASKSYIKKGCIVRLIIGYTGDIEDAKELKRMIKEKMETDVPFINLIPSVFLKDFGSEILVIAWIPVKKS